jgi:hypothetical protein
MLIEYKDNGWYISTELAFKPVAYVYLHHTVLLQQNGCFKWGRYVQLSTADSGHSPFVFRL